MDISELIQSGETASPESAASQTADLGREEFLSMLIAQLENQDPLNPQDATEFTAQLAQFSSLEQLISMRTSIDALANQQSAAQSVAAASLIGREALVSGDSFAVSGDPEQAPPRLWLDAAVPTEVSEVEIRNEQGAVVARSGELGTVAAGRSELSWSQFGAALPPGRYSAHVVTASDTQAPGLAVQSRITGASLDGSTPMLVMNGVEVPISSLLEVHE